MFWGLIVCVCAGCSVFTNLVSLSSSVIEGAKQATTNEAKDLGL